MLNFDQFDDEEKARFRRIAERTGIIPPERDGVFTEFGQAFAGATLCVGGAAGSTLEAFTGYSGMKDYFGNTMLRNRHYNSYPGYKALSLRPTDIARTIGTGLGFFIAIENTYSTHLITFFYLSWDERTKKTERSGKHTFCSK